MEFEPDISKLEKVVSKLLDEYDVVKKKCEQLTIDLTESLTEVESLKEENRILLNEKDTVHSQVSTILEKLSGWEDSLGAQDDSPDASASKDTNGQLFSMGSSS